MTRQPASAAQQDAICAAVRAATRLGSGPDASRLAREEDAGGLLALWLDPSVHAPIYSLPSPLTPETVSAFIAAHQAEREAGEGLLFVREDGAGRIVGYSDLQIWPHWAAGELGGALHPDLQSQGRGAAGAAMSFGWMFEALHLDLICETAATDNIRTARLLDALGFTRKGLVQSERPDGSFRESLVWELTRADWQAGRAR